jgi:uncharacterized protein (TIGR03083 family)
MDCYVHEQDMRRAVARAGHLDGPVAEHAIDRLIRTLPIVVGKRAATPEGATVVVRLTGPVTRSIPVTVTGGRAGVDESFAGDALTTVELDSEAFLVLATGRQDADDLAERWNAQGDEDLGRAVVTQLNMMI